MKTATIPASSSPMVRDPICSRSSSNSNSSCSVGTGGGNTDWRPYTGGVPDQTMSINNRNDDDNNDAVDDVAVGTGTNKKRKSDHQSRHHLRRKKSKHSIQANNNNNNITNLDDDDTNDGMHDGDNGDDNYCDNDDDDDPENEYDDDSDISVVATTDITTTTNGEKGVPNKQEEIWNEMYKRLQKYKIKYQSTSVPINFDEDRRLGNWVSNQRQFYRKNTLAKDRINRLISIDFVWNLNPSWNEMYERLVDYKKEKKSTCVPTVYSADPQLGGWVQNQRKFYNTNEPRHTADRIKITQLASIGFVWNMYDAKWTEKYDRLVKYKKQNKTTCVPRSYPTDPQLGNWVSQQRISYNTKQLSLTADRITQLDSIGFVWKINTKSKNIINK